MKLSINLVRLLKDCDKLNDTQFAQKLGVARMTWYRINTGKFPVSKEFTDKVVAAYPELKRIFLLKKGTTVTRAIQIAINSIPEEISD